MTTRIRYGTTLAGLALCVALCNPAEALALTTRPKGAPSTEGAWVDPAKVWREALLQHAPQTEPCIPAGTIFNARVTVITTTDGAVTSVEFHLSPTDAPEVAECLAAQVRTWTFPPASAPVTLRRFKWTRPGDDEGTAALKKETSRHAASRRRAIRACLKNAPLPDAGLTIHAAMRVEQDGTVSNVQIRGMEDAERQQCLAAALGGAKLQVTLHHAMISDLPLTLRRTAE